MENEIKAETIIELSKKQLNDFIKSINDWHKKNRFSEYSGIDYIINQTTFADEKDRKIYFDLLTKKTYSARAGMLCGLCDFIGIPRIVELTETEKKIQFLKKNQPAYTVNSRTIKDINQEYEALIKFNMNVLISNIKQHILNNSKLQNFILKFNIYNDKILSYNEIDYTKIKAKKNLMVEYESEIKNRYSKLLNKISENNINKIYELFIRKCIEKFTDRIINLNKEKDKQLKKELGDTYIDLHYCINKFKTNDDNKNELDVNIDFFDKIFCQAIYEIIPEYQEPESANIQDVSAANTTANNLNKQKNTINFRTFELTKWSDLSITIIDDRRLDIYFNNQQYTANYEEINFKMKNSNKPIKLWHFFLLFKEEKKLSLSIIDDLHTKNKLPKELEYQIVKRNQKEYIKDLKLKLKDIFNCQDEPIIRNAKTNEYYLNFKIQ